MGESSTIQAVTLEDNLRLGNVARQIMWDIVKNETCGPTIFSCGRLLVRYIDEGKYLQAIYAIKDLVEYGKTCEYKTEAISRLGKDIENLTK